MRNTKWLRYGLASIVVAGTGLGATLAACGDDDSGTSSGATPDTGTGDTGTGDTSTGDTGTDAKPDAGTLAKLSFANATTDMGPNAALGTTSAIRLCFKEGTTQANLAVAPLPPIPDKHPESNPTAPPGLYYGTGGTFPTFGLDLENRILVPYIMNAKKLATIGVVNPGNGSPGTTCDELVGDTKDAAAGLVENEDFWVLPQIDSGTLKKEHAYVGILTGCVGDATILNGETCGAGFTPGGGPGLGNLKLTVVEVNRTPISATALGAQFLHASPQAQAVFLAGSAGAITSVSPGFVSDPADGGNWKPVTDGGVSFPSAVTPVVAISGVVDSDSFALGQTNFAAPPQALLPFVLPKIEAVSYPGDGGAPAIPTIYKAGQNFVFIAVGDPSAQPFLFADGSPDDGGNGSKFNTRFFHFLAFPTDPVIEAYKP